MKEKLKIESKLYDNIVFRTPSFACETGGFVGVGKKWILTFQYDAGIKNGSNTQYYPNEQLLNEFIQEMDERCDYFGILHTHINHVDFLSKADEQFIRVLFGKNQFLEKIYFPLVLPKENMKIYVAVRCEGGVVIEKCDLIIYSS